MSGQPAALWGLTDRGIIAPGKVADMVAFDPNTISETPFERVYDFPANGDRLVSRSKGIEHIWVGGVATRRDGVDVEGASPGSSCHDRRVATIVDEIPIIDSDTHVIEPADLWTSAIVERQVGQPRSSRPLGRRHRAKRSGTSATRRSTPRVWRPALRWHEYPPDHPRRLADADPRSYDARRRLEHMDEYGVLAQVLYPNIGVFQVNEYIGMKADPATRARMRAGLQRLPRRLQCGRARPVRAVDDRAVLEPRSRHHASCIAATTSATKVWCSPRGWRTSTCPRYRTRTGIRSGPKCKRWTCRSTSTSGRATFPMFGTDNSGKHLNYAWTGSMLFFLNANAITSLIFGGVCQRFPRLKFVSVESGVGWVPFLLEGMDWQFHNSGAHIEHPELELLPSEYFARQIYSCFWFERASARAGIEQLGADHVMFEDHRRSHQEHDEHTDGGGNGQRLQPSVDPGISHLLLVHYPTPRALLCDSCSMVRKETAPIT